MTDKRILYMVTLLLLCFGMGVRAANVVSLSSTEGTPGEEVTVSLSLENSDAVSSLQLSIPLDEMLTLVEGSGLVDSRCGSHQLTVGVKDGVLNVLVYSVAMTPVSGSSGSVASFKLRLGNRPRTISLTPARLVLTDGCGQPLAGSTASGSVTIRCAEARYSAMEVDFGRVPIRSTYHEAVSIENVGNADLILTGLTFSDVNVLSTATTFPLTIGPGQSQQVDITYAPTERGAVTKTMKVECNNVSKLNTIAVKAAPFAVNELHVQPAAGTADEEVTVRLTMNNMDAISGYQVDFELPSQLVYVDGSFALSNRRQDHVATASLSGSTLRLIVYSPTDKPLTGDDGEIGTLRLKLAGRYGTTLTPKKVVLSATINNKVENVASDVYGGYISISSPQISTRTTLSFGAVPVTEACEQSLTVYNYGSAPLTISRTVFDNEDMSVKETLPLVIPANGSAPLTVVYGSVEQKPFEGTLHLYCNDPESRMVDVSVSGSRFAPNYLSLAAKELCTDEQAKIDIGTDTYDDITGIQFDLEYPKEYEALSDGSVVLAERAEGLTVTARQVGAQTLRFFCYSLSGAGIKAGQGRLMTVRLQPVTGKTAAGSYAVRCKNIRLGTQELANKYAGTDVVQAAFAVLPQQVGDANADGKVSIADVTAIINSINGGGAPAFVPTAADVNADGRTSISDVTGVINIINTRSE